MKKIFLLSAIVLVISFCSAQSNYLISSGGTVLSCSGYFYDSGDSATVYGNNEDHAITFKSVNTGYAHIKMVFSSFDVHPDDTLYVYDGPSANSPLIGKYNNDVPPPAFFISSVYNFSGELTFRFYSNDTNTADGWSALLSCSGPCQEVIAVINTSLVNPPPAPDGNVNLCPGEIVTLSGTAMFTQNDFLYHQGTSSCTYLWDFGDGQTASGQTVQHTYSQSQGYDVKLKVIDHYGCESNNVRGVKVRVPASPFVSSQSLPEICSGTQMVISAGTTPDSGIYFLPFVSVGNGLPPAPSAVSYNVEFIPDGPICLPGYVDIPLTVNSFEPDQLVVNADDIASVLVSIEHSYAGDLGFTLTCPNGQSVVLDGNDNSGGAALGQAHKPDGWNICNPDQNDPGNPWIYGWSESHTQQGYLNDLDDLYAYPVAIPAADTVHHMNYFTPDESFSGLIGCPFNGQWTLRVRDSWSVDNGYLFMWKTNFAQSLVTQDTGWNYTVAIDTMLWMGPYITHYDGSSVTIVPEAGGSLLYNLTFIDEYGCLFGTSLSLEVIQTPKVDLGNDTVICSDAIYHLDAGPGESYQWSTGDAMQTVPALTAGYYSVTVENQNYGGTLTCSGSDVIHIGMETPPEVDLGPDIYYYIGLPLPLDAHNPGMKYIWNTGDTTQVIIATQAGIYSVTVYDVFPDHTCQASDSLEVFTGSGMAEQDIPLVSVYPNPATGRFILKTDTYGNDATLAIYDLLGNLLLKQFIAKPVTEVDIASFAGGMYYIEFRTSRGIAVKKLLIE